MSEPHVERNTIVFLAVVVEGGLALLAIGIGHLFDHSPFTRLTLDLRGALDGLLATVPMVLRFLLVFHYPVGPLAGLKRFSETIIRPAMASCGLIDLAGISLLAGLGEELLFRGLFQDLLAGWGPTWLAVLIASALFGILHAVTPTYAVLATLMGAYLGAVYLWTENLTAAVTAHAAYDLFALVYLLYAEEPLTDEEEEEDEEQP